jgi:hypothetical protein
VKIAEVPGECADPRAISPQEFSGQGEVRSRKKLSKQLSVSISDRRKVYIDSSQRWDKLDSAVGARTAQLRGLMDAGSSKAITIDLSNYRPAALREGAIVRIQKNLGEKEWRKAFRDIEIGLLVETLCAEVERIVRNPNNMPQLELVCQDQPLLTAVYPMVTELAVHAKSLPRLMRLDLNRYSRSTEVSEANLPTDKAVLKAYDKFIDRIAQLLDDSPSLRELGLRMNGVDSFALAIISDALAENQVLERLDMSSNPLCTETSEARRSHLGIRVLAKALRKHCAVKHLDLSFCALGECAADILLRALGKNKSLKQINLGGNPIPPGHAIFDDQRVVRIVSIKPAG